MKNRYTLLVIVFLFSVFGCTHHKQQPNQSTSANSQRTSGSHPVLNEFTWGDAIIRLGMSKAEVLKNVEIGFIMNGSEKIRIDTPGESQSDSWALPYGHHGGTAPGCGVL